MSFAAKMIGKKILGETMQNKFGTEDPYFEMVPASRLDGRPSNKLKKRKKALPPGISEHDGMVLTKVKRRAYRLDMALFNFLGIRFGWGSAIGIVPFAGDALDSLMALMVMKTCYQVEGGLPTSVKIQMMFNIVFDFVIGLVPFIGDLADAVFRANTRNAVLLESHLREKGKKNLRRSGQPMPSVDPSSPVEFDRDQREEPPTYAPDLPPGHQSSARPQRSYQQAESTPPPQMPAKTKSGWFGWNKSRPNDVETGQMDNGSRNLQQDHPGGWR